MTALSDFELLEVYKKATYYELSDEFIHLIEEEISKRKLNMQEAMASTAFEEEGESQSAI